MILRCWFSYEIRASDKQIFSVFNDSSAVFTKSNPFKAEEQMLEVQIGMKVLQVKHFWKQFSTQIKALDRQKWYIIAPKNAGISASLHLNTVSPGLNSSLWIPVSPIWSWFYDMISMYHVCVFLSFFCTYCLVTKCCLITLISSTPTFS